MNIEITQSISGIDFYFYKGQLLILPDLEAEKLIKIGFARKLTENPILKETIKTLIKSQNSTPEAPPELDTISELAKAIILKADKGDPGDKGESVIKDNGTLNFNNARKGIINFNLVFLKKPSIMVSFLDNSQAPSYNQNISFTGFTIIFPIPFSGQIEWFAIEK